MKARIKRIKQKDDRNLLALSHTVQGRAVDSLASAMKNLDLGKLDMTMVHLVDVLDYLMEYKNTTHEIWKRYRKKKRECRRKTAQLKHMKKGWVVVDLNDFQVTGEWAELLFKDEGSE